MVAGRGGLRCLFDCFDPEGRVRGEESLGIDRERDLARCGGVVPVRDLQRPLDALGLYHHPETRGAAAHLNGDPYHLPTSLLLRITTPTSVRAAFTPTATQCRPSLLQPGNRRINNRTQFRARICAGQRSVARTLLTEWDPDSSSSGGSSSCSAQPVAAKQRIRTSSGEASIRKKFLNSGGSFQSKNLEKKWWMGPRPRPGS